MRFLIDNQLPPILAGWLCDRGHDAIHAFDAGLARLDDRALWADAIAEGWVVISKDENFPYLANQSAPGGRLLWVRLGNCRNTAAFTPGPALRAPRRRSRRRWQTARL